YWIASTPGGSRLWRTDGTPAGTRQVSDLTVAFSSYTLPVILGEKVFFTANGPLGVELYVSDGTAAGTRLVTDIRPGAAGSTPSMMRVLGNRVLFGADDGVHGRELWITDGSAAGTALVADINPGAASALTVAP